MQRQQIQDQEHDACGVGFIYSPETGHQTIDDALTALCRLEHRGALGADGISGDGAGILTSIPWKILESEGFDRSKIRAVGVMFLPADNHESCRQICNEFLAEYNLIVEGWRRLPVRKDVLGPDAAASCPQIEFVLISADNSISDDELEKKLLIARKLLILKLYAMQEMAGFYIASLSTSTVVYKAMVKSESLALFYEDLQNELFEAKWAIFHRRFSTNTSPNWRLAQPFRMLAHNGEINTLSGNRNWLHAREMIMDNPLFSDRRDVLRPLVHPLGSDSANLDNLFELLVLSELSPQEAMMRLIPEAHSESCHLSDPSLASFYEYHAALQEPWDGPALIAFTDGKFVGASLDRNGLRPARYTLLKNGAVVLCSETGVLDLPVEQIAEKGRLGPGEMIAVEIATGKFQRNSEIKSTVSRLHPYQDWLKDERISLSNAFAHDPHRLASEELLAQQLAVGYSDEDMQQIIGVMAETGHEPIFSMGDDAALAVLSKHPRSLFDYFRQRFAQVTNPPIDHLREEMVFSLNTYLGEKSTAVHAGRTGARVLKLESPILSEAQLAEIETVLAEQFHAGRVSLSVPLDQADLEKNIRAICIKAAESVKNGSKIIILNDRESTEEHLLVPVLLAVGAVHNYLTEQGLRMSCSIVVDTAQAWSTHHLACLLGFGAEAICPYLAFESIRHHAPIDIESGTSNYIKAANSGLLKIMSKMGISALTSYIGARIFECVGINKAVIDFCFPGTPSQLSGLTFADIEREMRRFHNTAYKLEAAQLENRGLIRHRNNGEYHGNNPELITALHKALGYRNLKTGEERLNEFLRYASLTRKHAPGAVRDLLTFITDRKPISLEEVEPAEKIVSRFCSGGMSLGALSPEAHTSLAVAMNRIGAKSNSGEGGEDPARYRNNLRVNADGTSSQFPGVKGLKQGDSAASAIRQVASARFGVTTEYLATAKQLEIKMAQGAKPGEGGQLPGAKVSSYIAKLRHADAGTTLISPPTHHDIYSIEDLAQLIYDLKQVNPKAAVSVKLVAESGIGTIAAGVAKANADIIQISGHDGGTGASPLSSIKHAGIPWELGLAEVQRVLCSTRLRERVTLRVDGGLRSAWDIIIAALLGAEEFGFGSIALVAQGCIMARVCHTNNCPVGITSQKEELRKKFPGVPEKIVDFFMFLAEDVRYMLAELGYKSLGDLVGRADLLRERSGIELNKTASLDLTSLLEPQIQTPGRGLATSPHKFSPPAKNSEPQNLNSQVFADTIEAIRKHETIEKSYKISNYDRSTGARISGEIASNYGERGFRGNVTLNFEGSSGQSFGAFLVNNIRLSVHGECNDYVGKGMSGGEIIVRPPSGYSIDKQQQNTIVGNACLYGATGGALFAAGQAGERFAVRNSRAKAVVEGAGDHCCEYMTGGTVAVLGRAGRNFGAGMTGGQAFVLDEDDSFSNRCNIDFGSMELRRPSDNDLSELKSLIEKHHALTSSARAGEILEHWQAFQPLFWQIQVKQAEEFQVFVLSGQQDAIPVADRGD